MVRLIVGIVVLLALGVLIILNVNYKSPLNLFGAQLSNVSVVVIAIVSFLLGIIYSFIVSVVNRIRKGRKNGRKRVRDDLNAKAVELEQREKAATIVAESNGADSSADRKS